MCPYCKRPVWAGIAEQVVAGVISVGMVLLGLYAVLKLR